MPLRIGNEWVLVTSVASNSITVTRAQYGTVAAPYTSGTSIRSAYLERGRDLVYNPNWYIAETDFFGLLQTLGFARFNQYTLSIGVTGFAWGAYKLQTQPAVRGDASDGKVDNRLCLATPGKAHTKTATTNQDQVNGSVRGQAFLDWMTPSSGPSGPSTSVPKLGTGLGGFTLSSGDVTIGVGI
jgi:hypothetical protein